MTRTLLAAVLAATLLLALFLLTGLPLAGEHIAVIAGRQQDPHLLTGWIWVIVPAVIRTNIFFRTCAVATLAIAGALLVSALRSRRLTFVGLALGVVFATSPFAIGTMLDPLATDSIVTLAIFLLIALDVADLWPQPLAIRCLLAAALSLQDVALTPAAIIYGLAVTGSTISALAQVGAVLAAVAVRVFFAPLTLQMHPLFDFTAGPATVVAIAVLLFAVMPATLLAAGRITALPDAVRTRAFIGSVVLAVTALGAGVASETGDPSVAWLCAELAAVAGLAHVARVGAPSLRWPVAMTLVTVICVQVVVTLTVANSLPAVALATTTADLSTASQNAAAIGDRLCVTTDAAGARHVLAYGTLLAATQEGRDAMVVARPEACIAAWRRLDIATITDMSIVDWGSGGADISRAAQILNRAQPLPVYRGIVSPKTHAPTPTGFGAFGNGVQTPIGATSIFTVLSGFSYTFPCVPPGDRLSFAVAPLPHSAMTYAVTESSGGRRRIIFTEGVKADPLGGGAQAWRLRVVDLPASRACRALTFVVYAEPGVPTTWVGFAAPAISGDAR